MTNNLDVAALRALTPGCATGVHFNHAGASLPSSATLDAITDHLHREALCGPMEAASEVQSRLDQVRSNAATLLNATAAEIAFTSGGSAAWGSAFAALPALRPGDRILVGRQEWGGNLATMQAAADEAGATVEVIPCLEDGSIDAEALAAVLDDRVRLISLTWLPANGGLIHDVVVVGRIARAAGIPYFIDAGQAMGQLPIDVQAIGCDVLKSAGRKHLRGPRGTAILYVRGDFLPRLRPRFFDVLSAPWVADGPYPRTDARLFETSETSVALLLGLGNALKEALSLGVPTIHTRIQFLAKRMRDELSVIPGVKLQDMGSELSGLVSFTMTGLEAAEVRNRLAQVHIRVGANGPAYTPLDMAARGLDGIVRASLSYLNTEEEIEGLALALRNIGKKGAG